MSQAKSETRWLAPEDVRSRFSSIENLEIIDNVPYLAMETKVDCGYVALSMALPAYGVYATPEAIIRRFHNIDPQKQEINITDYASPSLVNLGRLAEEMTSGEIEADYYRDKRYQELEAKIKAKAADQGKEHEVIRSELAFAVLDNLLKRKIPCILRYAGHNVLAVGRGVYKGEAHYIIYDPQRGRLAEPKHAVELEWKHREARYPDGDTSFAMLAFRKKERPARRSK